MGVRQKNYDPANGLALLKLALGEQQANREPGVVPGSMAQNAYAASIPNTNEQEREARDVDALDAGASERYQAGLDQNKEIDIATTGAHAMGFDNPRAQMEDTAMKKLQQVLLPAQEQTKAAGLNATANREFLASEHDQDRQARADVVRAQQSGQTQRQQTTIGQQNQVAAAKYKQQHPILNFFGLGQPAPMEQPKTLSGATDTSATVEMVTPDGRTLDVPAEKVAEMEAAGATRK